MCSTVCSIAINLHHYCLTSRMHERSSGMASYVNIENGGLCVCVRAQENGISRRVREHGLFLGLKPITDHTAYHDGSVDHLSAKHRAKRDQHVLVSKCHLALKTNDVFNCELMTDIHRRTVIIFVVVFLNCFVV